MARSPWNSKVFPNTSHSGTAIHLTVGTDQYYNGLRCGAYMYAGISARHRCDGTFKTRWIHLVSKWAPMAAPGAMAEDVNSTNSRQFKLYELCIWTSTGGCLETTIVGRCICAAVKPRGFRLGDPGVVSCQRIHRSKWLAGQAPGPVGEAPC